MTVVAELEILEVEMIPEPITSKLLDELTGFAPEVFFKPFTKARYLRECKKALQVDAVNAYMCMGIVHGHSDDFLLMKENFQAALSLDPNDMLILRNYVTSLGNFGRYSDVVDIISKNNELLNSEFCFHALLRALSGTLNLTVLDDIAPSYTERARKTLSILNVQESDVRQLMLTFNSLMEKQNVRFGVQFNSSWHLDDDMAYLYYDFFGTPNDAMKIMKEFDQLVVENNMGDVASKVIIILLPIKSSVAA